MFRTLQGAIVGVAAAALLTGCGGGGGGKGTDQGKGADSGHGKAAVSQSATPTAGADGAVHEVTMEVTGTGTTQVMYHAASSGFEKHQLPWTKTEKVTLTDAEQKVGYLVSVVPGSVQAADGTLTMGGCVIKVDGKQVADNNGGKVAKGCEYKIK
ncbi:hypothetical protein [Streptomyces sp. NPDC127190]|uniref:hypothetical protein n=1 Tax=unclassified Streptomyces TaxID=2593676 RepID=UPI003633D004